MPRVKTHTVVWILTDEGPTGNFVKIDEKIYYRHYVKFKDLPELAQSSETKKRILCI